MDLQTSLITILVAAAIGAGTNELAIITILKYILPRKKGELARRIRDIVSTELMSPALMRAKLGDPEVVRVIRRNVDRAAAEYLARDLPAPAALLKDNSADFDAFVARLRESLLDGLAAVCSDPAFVSGTLRPFLAERWQTLRQRTPKSLLPGGNGSAGAFVRGFVAGLEESETFRQGARDLLNRWLSARLGEAGCAADLLPPSVRGALGGMIASQTPLLVDQLAGALRTPEMRDAVAGSIISAVRAQLRTQGMLGELKGMLANAMRLEKDIYGFCERLPAILRHNLNEPGNRKILEQALQNGLENALGKPLPRGEGMDRFRLRAVELVMDRLWRPEVFAELAQRAGALADEVAGQPLAEIAARVGLDDAAGAALDEAAAKCRRFLTSQATRALMAARFDEAVSAWRERPLGRLDRFATPEIRSRLAVLAADEGLEVLKARFAELSEEAGVWNVLSESVENYDDRQLSDMVLQLARSELRWVTILGGVIGGMVGALQAFFMK